MSISIRDGVSDSDYYPLAQGRRRAISPDALGGSDGGEAAVTHAGVQRRTPASRETEFADSLGVPLRVQGQHYPVGSIDPKGRPVE